MRTSLRRLAIAAAALAAGVGLTATPALAAPAEGTIDGANEAGSISGSFLVTLRADAPVEQTAAALVQRYGGSVGEVFTDTVAGFALKSTEARAKAMAADPLVVSVEQDKRVSLLSSTQTNPPSWGLDRIDQVSLPLDASYTSPTDASNVTVYVIDTGIRTTHVEFGGRASSGYDFVDDDADATDCNGHGTHVAATIGGNTYGVAKGVHLVAVRVLDCSGYGSYDKVIAGIDWVAAHASGPSVVNMSLGGPQSAAVDAAVRSAIAGGITFALAAGNANTDACTVTPADVTEAITVGATDSTDTRASFSNYGNCLDLFAPGVGITSAYDTADTATATMSGTSMASPHVAGAAALVLANHPSYTPAQVRDALVGGAVQAAHVGTDAGGVSVAGTTTTRLLYTGPVSVQAPTMIRNPVPVAPVRVAAVPCNVRTNGANVAIRDRGTALDPVAVTGCAGKASPSTRVVVHIVHPHRGDLTVELVAPNGRAKKLKASNKRDAGRNVDVQYTVNMGAYNRNGTWKLRVSDGYKGNVGYVDSWTLTV
jgi:subtilisin family serine protease